MNMRKDYIPPHSEVVFVCKDICEGEHQPRMSKFTDGHGGEGDITLGTGPGDAKEYGWDLWDDFDAANW